MKAIDTRYLRIAIEEAEKANQKGEVPVGAVIVHDGDVIAVGYNLTETNHDPTAHAEIVAIRRACQKLESWRLFDASIYVTLEPCPMCIGAIINAKISRLVFGAYDDRYGAAVSKINMPELFPEYGRLQVIGGLLKEDCQRLLERFFAIRR
ncbi:MAG: tRNA adenosine(34) deaminase TadA [Candidatus Zixiibacteriota bacterium]